MNRWMNYPEEMVAEPNGPYVLYEDHLAAVEEGRMEAFAAAAVQLGYFNGRYLGKDTTIEAMSEWLKERAEGKP